jgi:hypothetical protein
MELKLLLLFMILGVASYTPGYLLVVYDAYATEPDEDCLYDTSLPKCTPGPPPPPGRWSTYKGYRFCCLCPHNGTTS